MTLYTFYCRRADGAPLSIHTADLATDAAAALWAQGVLAEHRSCDAVDVFENDRSVATAMCSLEGARAWSL